MPLAQMVLDLSVFFVCLLSVFRLLPWTYVLMFAKYSGDGWFTYSLCQAHSDNINIDPLLVLIMWPCITQPGMVFHKHILFCFSQEKEQTCCNCLDVAVRVHSNSSGSTMFHFSCPFKHRWVQDQQWVSLIS